MLTSLHIRDYAIVRELALELAPGMTVLTGETGAGKSILVDALGLVLGDRADSTVVRAGCAQAEVHAEFDLGSADAARAWLEEQALAGDESCLLRRVVSAQGRSRAWINGRPTPVQQLQELGELLVDIHGQHAHQSLLRRPVQRALLDAHGGHQELATQVAELARRWREEEERLQALRGSGTERAERAEWLRFQLSELDALELRDDEWEGLSIEHDRLAHAEELLAACHQASEALYEGEDRSLHDQLSTVADLLAPLVALDAQIAAAHALLGECAIGLQEANRALRAAADQVDLDPERLRQTERRLQALHETARKHRTSPAELPALQRRLAEELQSLEHGTENLDELERRLAQLRHDYEQAAQRLSAARQRAARELSAAVSEAMQGLAMAGGRFEIALAPVPADPPAAGGWETVEFLVSANPGQPPLPLAKVASGGELSRISLALQVVAIASATIPTLIFDEVDVGIGGAVAETVGSLLRQLGEERQVLCVTHLPQVAALGHQHLLVSKELEQGHALAVVEPVRGPGRVAELARMLGGKRITAQTEAHAQEMIDRWQQA